MDDLEKTNPATPLEVPTEPTLEDIIDKTNPATPLEVPTEPSVEDIVNSTIEKESASKKKASEELAEMIEGVEKSVADFFGGPVRVTKVTPDPSGGFEFTVSVRSGPTEETHTVIVKDPPKLP